MYKKKIIAISITFVISLFSLLIINYSLDPFQVFHKSWFDNSFSKEQRYQNAGLINSYLVQDKYNATVIGDSMSQCFSMDYVNTALKWKTLKLSIPGSTLPEQYHVIERALETGDIKNVVWVIDANNYLDNTIAKYGFPVYLYDNDSKNDIDYLLSFAPVRFYVSKMRKKLDLKHSNYWCDDKEQLEMFIKYNMPDNLIKLADNIKTNTSKFSKLDSIASAPFDEYIKPIIGENPNVNFYIIYPPKSLLSKLSGGETLYLRKFLTLKLLKYKNVKVYGFDNVKAITSDMNNYKDGGHYRPWVNDYMIDAIANDTHRLTKDNIDAYMNDIIEQIKNYKICSNGKCYD